MISLTITFNIRRTVWRVLWLSWFWLLADTFNILLQKSGVMSVGMVIRRVISDSIPRPARHNWGCDFDVGSKFWKWFNLLFQFIAGPRGGDTVKYSVWGHWSVKWTNRQTNQICLPCKVETGEPTKQNPFLFLVLNCNDVLHKLIFHVAPKVVPSPLSFFNEQH